MDTQYWSLMAVWPWDLPDELGEKAGKMAVNEYDSNPQKETYRLSVIIPCYNEMATLQRCVARVMSIASDNLTQTILLLTTQLFEFYSMKRIWAKERRSGAEFPKRQATLLRSRTRT